MAKKRQKKDAPSAKDSVLNINHIPNSENNIQSADTSMDDSKKGRHFWYVVYPSEKYIRDNYPDCEYDGSAGWGEAPDDWVEQLINTGLSFHVSTLHYLDVNPDGKVKKPHWHVIVSWGNTTTYRSARGLCDLLKCPRPQLLKSPNGAYRYARHADNPEKYQYEDSGKSYNGWNVPLDNNEVERLKREIVNMILFEDVQEYIELIFIARSMGAEYENVVNSNTFFFDKVVTSYRHNKLRALNRAFSLTHDEATKKSLTEIISYESELMRQKKKSPE